jgi:hypothetical protein
LLATATPKLSVTVHLKLASLGEVKVLTVDENVVVAEVAEVIVTLAFPDT